MRPTGRLLLGGGEFVGGSLGTILSSSMPYAPSRERCLTVGFSVRHLGGHLLARHLVRGVPEGLLVEALCLFFLAPCRPDFFAVRGDSVGGLRGTYNSQR
jgi:hypothetical protein